MSHEPAVDRPEMPGYGIADSAEGLLPWDWAVERLSRSRRYWLTTRTQAGAPHLAAVWAVWFDDAICFSTGACSRKARNLAADPRCGVAPESALESVVVEGIAERVTATDVLAGIGAAYLGKYGSGLPDAEPVYAVRPSTVIAVIETEPEFTTRATRWRFPDA